MIDNLNEIILSIEDINSILVYFNEYIENEHHCFSKHFFDEEERIVQTIHIINSIVILFMFYIKYKDDDINYIAKELGRYIDLTSDVRELFGVNLLFLQYFSISFLEIFSSGR